ncbi:SRPBCC domain-containing protein [Natronoarchaeum rubrum]|uniref:SRPBCC domain-containing protein n=1 Tax=Natronoarchaeum rubrum TaxID=755311 RepID=UPI0021119A12|nr:SRPBCC domain-containing protein [Natronoarchaeum rubrum]
MRTIESALEIDAPPEDVWTVLTNFDEYVEWNSFIPRASGDARKGGRLDLKIDPPGAREYTTEPKVTVVEEPHRLVWLSRVGFPHLFDERHSFSLGRADDATRFRHHVVFGGVLVPLLLREDAVRRGVDAMSVSLKRRVERRAPVRA